MIEIKFGDVGLEIFLIVAEAFEETRLLVDCP